jgi:hypothetical protein
MIGLHKRALVIALFATPTLATTPHNNCPDAHAWTGHVTNYNYGFAFDVPHPLKAYWNSPRCSSQGSGCTCMQDHGRAIPLRTRTDRTDRQIEISSDSYDPDDSPLQTTTTDPTEQFMGKALVNSLQLVSGNRTHITGTEGHHLVVRYLDKGTGVPMVQETYVLVRQKKFRYTLYLLTPAVTYMKDRLFLRDVVSSFRLTHGEY